TEPRPVNANVALVEDPVLYINETSAWWGEVTTQETPLRTAFVVYNPKPVPYAVTEIGYTIRMNDIVVGEGSTSQLYAIPPRSEQTIQASTAIDNPTLDEWWVSHLERNQVTRLHVDFYAVVELPGGQRVRVPLDEIDYEETIETDIFGTKPEAPTDQSDTTPDTGSTPRSSSSDTPTSSPTPTATPTTDEQPPSPTATPTDGLPVGL
ncbi:MAG: LEA type 2 family protein, partial [Halobacteriales archaeon]|nr:LEA type 2 family protein [Halobacteriales archaeon]